jgi:hypothetical protein
MRVRKRKISGTVLLGSLLSPLPVRAEPEGPVDHKPPPPIREARPAPPATDTVWLPGYWRFRRGDFEWVHGRWARRRAGQVWIEDRWAEIDGRWYRLPGAWEDEEHMTSSAALDLKSPAKSARVSRAHSPNGVLARIVTALKRK